MGRDMEAPADGLLFYLCHFLKYNLCHTLILRHFLKIYHIFFFCKLWYTIKYKNSRQFWPLIKGLKKKRKKYIYIKMFTWKKGIKLELPCAIFSLPASNFSSNAFNGATCKLFRKWYAKVSSKLSFFSSFFSLIISPTLFKEDGSALHTYTHTHTNTLLKWWFEYSCFDLAGEIPKSGECAF